MNEVRTQSRDVVEWLGQSRIEDQMKRALPAHIDPAWFLRTAQTVILSTPKLLNANRDSLLRELVAVAELGLVFNPALGEAWLIADSKGNVQRRIGYQGLAKLAMQSGMVTMVNAQVVHANDITEIRLGDNPGVKHSIDIKAAERGPVIGCYAVARIKDVEAPLVEWMSWAEIEAHRDRYSDAYRYKTGPWTDDLAQYEMGRKTPFRRLVKWLPKSPMLAREMDHESEVDRIMSARDITEEVDSAAPKLTSQVRPAEPRQTTPAAQATTTAADTTTTAGEQEYDETHKLWWRGLGPYDERWSGTRLTRPRLVKIREAIEDDWRAARDAMSNDLAAHTDVAGSLQRAQEAEKVANGDDTTEEANTNQTPDPTLTISWQGQDGLPMSEPGPILAAFASDLSAIDSLEDVAEFIATIRPVIVQIPDDLWNELEAVIESRRAEITETTPKPAAPTGNEGDLLGRGRE